MQDHRVRKDSSNAAYERYLGHHLPKGLKAEVPRSVGIKQSPGVLLTNQIPRPQATRKYTFVPITSFPSCSDTQGAVETCLLMVPTGSRGCGSRDKIQDLYKVIIVKML